MAREPRTLKKTTANPPTIKDDAALIMGDDFFDGLDSGMERVDSQDVALPRWTILQGLSPQVNPRKDEYIEGSVVGDIVNLATGAFFKTRELVFAGYERRYLEWSPRQDDQVCPLEGFPKPYGQGLINDYGVDGTILGECTRDDETGRIWTKRGNELVVTGTWYCVDVERFSIGFIAMGKTQFTASKKLMSAIRDERVLHNGTLRVPPIFWRIWTLGTHMRERDNNTWFVWSHKPGGLLREHPNGTALLGVIKDFQQMLKDNAIRVDLSDAEGEYSSGHQGSDGDAM